MREIKAFLIIIILIGVLYYGIEPLANSVLYGKTEDVNYNFESQDIALLQKDIKQEKNDLEKIIKGDANKDSIDNQKKLIENKNKSLENYKIFWKDVNNIKSKKGNPKKGEETIVVAGCTSCHSIKDINITSPLSNKDASESFGVVPPDLSSSKNIYSDNFLIAVIKNPALALKVTHKYDQETPFPMPNYIAIGEDPDQEIVDIVAFLKSMPQKNITGEQIYQDACQRCHDIKYDNKFIYGNKQALKNYVSLIPSDLSLIGKIKSEKYLHSFINDPQSTLPRTLMPRVGLNKQAQDKVITYMKKISDPQKEEREKTAIDIMIYFMILSILAILWKKKVWSKLQ